MKQWTAHCQTCSWAGVRCEEEINPKQSKTNHLKHHPEHKVNIFITGEQRFAFPSASLYDMGSYPNLPVKINP
jgi:hypothetical protein